MEPNSKNYFALALQERMAELGHGKAKVVAIDAGVDPGTLTKLKYGQVNAGVEKLDAVAMALDSDYVDMIVRGREIWLARFGGAEVGEKEARYSGDAPPEFGGMLAKLRTDEVDLLVTLARALGDLAELRERVKRLEGGCGPPSEGEG
jgi:hypothetical protein